MIMKKYWWLGLLGFIGFLEIPGFISYFQGDGTVWNLVGLLWFLWFIELLPTKKIEEN